MKSPPLFRSVIGAAMLLIAGFALWAAIGHQTQGAISFGILYVVDSTGEGDLVGPSTICDDGTGHCTLRAAIEASNLHAGTDGISFNIPTSDPGYNAQTGTWTVSTFSSLPDMSDSVNITGPGSAKLIIDGGGDSVFGHRVFNVTTAGTVSFSGLTIANGFTSNGQYGAAIQNVNGGTVNITNCTLSHNQSHVGSAQYDGGGGAIFNAGSGTVNITNSTFTLNRADTYGFSSFGGAIWNKTGTIHVSNTMFDHNGIIGLTQG